MELENDARHVLDGLEADVRLERKQRTACELLDDAFEDELDNDFGGDFC
jgi:hypothetical protein